MANLFLDNWRAKLLIKFMQAAEVNANTPMTAPRVFAVVVAYGLQGPELGPLLNTLTQQVQRVVLVVNPMADGANHVNLPAAHQSHVEVLQQTHNIGLAAAQNLGISKAKEQGADAVLFLDDDSLPNPNMVSQLVLAWQQLLARGQVRVGALGSVYLQPEGGQWKGFVRIRWNGFKRCTSTDPQSIVPADFLIASGTLVPISVFDQVGGMDEGLFIDHVDTEWCLRAASQGFELFGVCAAKMHHTLGTKRQKVWWFGTRMVSHHSPLRYFYMFRNSMLIYRRAHIPFTWKYWDFFRNLRLLVFMALFSPPRASCVGMMLRGFKHGWQGRQGPAE
jgi:rhamnosyltransferase